MWSCLKYKAMEKTYLQQLSVLIHYAFYFFCFPNLCIVFNNHHITLPIYIMLFCRLLSSIKLCHSVMVSFTNYVLNIIIKCHEKNFFSKTDFTLHQLWLTLKDSNWIQSWSTYYLEILFIMSKIQIQTGVGLLFWR